MGAYIIIGPMGALHLPTRNVDTLSRRAHMIRTGLMLAASSSSTAAIAASPLSSPVAFALQLPPSFVKLSNTQSPDILLFAGDFRNMIASTGAATTITVQRLPVRPGLLPVTSDEEASSAARKLAAVRDSQSGLSCDSEVLGSTVKLDAASGELSFEFLTPLTCGGGGGASTSEASAELVRHTLVRAALLPSGDGDAAGDRLLVLWAGARAADWDAGVGAELEAAGRTFAVGSASPTKPQEQMRSGVQSGASLANRCTNAHYGPGWAGTSSCP